MSDLAEKAKAAFGGAVDVVDEGEKGDGGAKEWRIFGPPGTGKTTYLGRQIQRAVEVVGSANVMVASFTRAAAAEIVGRKLPIDNRQVGTLHSFAYRALGTPPLAEAKLEEWNEYAPMYALSSESVGTDVDEPGFEQNYATAGDELAARAQLLRARMVPVELWPVQVAAFQRKWNVWKAEAGVIDFTDMIEKAWQDVDAAPGEPEIGLFDEVQDFAPLELALVRKWAGRMHMVLLAGDDDQAIYSFKGAQPDAFLNPPLPPQQVRVLSQSYRVPRVIQAVAQNWIEKVRTRQVKDYKPKQVLDANGKPTGEFVEGSVRRLDHDPRLQGATWKNPEPLVEDAMRYVEAGRTVMFLAACSYMLEPLKNALRNSGLPFHNPYRRKRGDWNPLHPGRGTSTADRVLAYLAPGNGQRGERWNPFWEPGEEPGFLWTYDELNRWLALVKTSGVLARGAKTRLEKETGDWPVRQDHLLSYFEQAALLEAQGLDLSFLAKHALASKAGALEFPIKVAQRYGQDALTQQPKIIIGTIHSVKGGEADVVYLFPDLSRAGYEEWSRPGEAQDGIRRLMYVGMTRTRDVLALCSPAGPMAVKF